MEKLAAALEVLDSWDPDRQKLAEVAVALGMDIQRGRILRLQGNFNESLPHLSRPLPSDCLLVDEDRLDHAHELADTLRELDKVKGAEELLREVIGRGPARALTKLCLAETLFSQNRFAEAENICREVKTQNVAKVTELRLHITHAKIRHVQHDREAAFEFWTAALKTINKYPPTSWLTTRAIYLSLCHLLHQQGRQELQMESRRQVTALEQVSSMAEARYWIPGLKHWLAMLDFI